jgi:hypothetical protein
VTLLGASFLGIIASLPTWLNARGFPLAPIVPSFPIVPAPWDKYFLGAMLLSLVLAVWFYRPAVTTFLVLSLYAFCEDQNRGQPWFYMYWVMLLLTLFPGSTALAACRFAISVAYIWSGIQKCNAGYQGVPSWFVAPAAHWHLPEALIAMLRWSVAAAPFTEIGIGVGLWHSRLRGIVMWAVLILHVMAVLFLGPLGHNYNWVVWPWNLAMIALVWVLFTADTFWQGRVRSAGDASAKDAKVKPADRSYPAVPGGGVRKAFADLRRSRAAMCAVGLYAALPVLSYAGWWDSYFSFSLYSGNIASVNIFVTQPFADRLPPKLAKYVQPFQTNYDPQHQGPLLFNIDAWAYEEMHVPPVPEVRNYQSVYRALRAYSKEPGDLRMIIGPRAGPVLFQEGDRYELLRPLSR